MPGKIVASLACFRSRLAQMKSTTSPPQQTELSEVALQASGTPRSRREASACISPDWFARRGMREGPLSGKCHLPAPMLDGPL